MPSAGVTPPGWKTLPVMISGSPRSFSGEITVFHESFSGSLHDPQGAPPLRVEG
jgi:hypothetical protein